MPLGQWDQGGEEDRSDIASSSYSYQKPDFGWPVSINASIYMSYMLLSFAQGVRDLVISANSQTQAAVANANSQTQATLAATNASLQSIGAEVFALKELYLRKPFLKKKVG